MRAPLPTWIPLTLLLIALPAAAGTDPCGGTDAAVVGDIAVIREGEQRPSPVYYGTTRPSHVPLTDGQILAIGEFGNGGCTGTVIADGWVLTARHCDHRRGGSFKLGADPKNADVHFTIAEVYTNPSNDLALVRLDRSTREALPELEPIPLFTGTADRSWVGRTAEAAGYGQQETGRFGEREFSAEPIAFVDSRHIAIDGEGRRGVCFGDSGGPLLVIAEDGTVRVAGALEYGDPSCVGIDRYTRVDNSRQWLESILGPIQEPEPVEDTRPVVGCPEGTEPYQASTYAFRELLCRRVGAAGEVEYIAWHEGVWWIMNAKLNATQMQFRHPGTGTLHTLSASQLARVAEPGTVNELVYPEGAAVALPEEGEEEVRVQSGGGSSGGGSGGSSRRHTGGTRRGLLGRLFGR